MKTQVDATVMGGGLQLDEPLDLPDQLRVQVSVEPLACTSDYAAALADFARLCKERPIDSGGIRFTRDKLHERS